MNIAELQAKFHQLASNAVGEERIKHIIAAIGKLENTTDISNLIGLLVV